MRLSPQNSSTAVKQPFCRETRFQKAAGVPTVAKAAIRQPTSRDRDQAQSAAPRRTQASKAGTYDRWVSGQHSTIMVGGYIVDCSNVRKGPIAYAAPGRPAAAKTALDQKPKKSLPLTALPTRWATASQPSTTSDSSAKTCPQRKRRLRVSQGAYFTASIALSRNFRIDSSLPRAPAPAAGSAIGQSGAIV
jgi:hypothetical protein